MTEIAAAGNCVARSAADAVYVTSCELNSLGTALLVCLSSNHTIEYVLEGQGRGALLSEGHGGAVLSLSLRAGNEGEAVMASVGTDGVLKLWSMGEGSSRVVETVTLPHAPTAAAFSPDGSALAVAIRGTDTGGNYAGVLIMDFALPQFLAKRDGTDSASDAEVLTTRMKLHNVGQGVAPSLKYTGNLLGVVSTENRVFLYNAADGYKELGSTAEHTGTISGFDLSAGEQQFLRTFSGEDMAGVSAGRYLPSVRVFDLKDPGRNCGAEVQSEDMPAGVTWLSASSALAPECGGLATRVAHVNGLFATSLHQSQNLSVLCMEDGTAFLTRSPGAVEPATTRVGCGVLGRLAADTDGRRVVLGSPLGSITVLTVA